MQWTQVTGPALALTDPSALVTSFNAPPAGAGPIVLTWQLNVTGDQGLQAQDEVTITVARAQAVAPIASAGADQQVDAGARVVLNGSLSSDADSSDLSFLWQQRDTDTQVILEDATTATPEFIAPAVTDSGEVLQFTLTVTDNDGLSSSDSVDIAVRRAGDLDPPLVAILPSVRTVNVGTPATAFATFINAGGAAIEDCSIAADTPFPGSLSYQTTDSASNALTGSANAPITIAAGQAQSFVFAITPTAPFPQTELHFVMDCSNTPRARVVSGLSTLLLTATETPAADVVALAITPSGDGLLRIPGAAGSAAFGVANFNLGSTEILSVQIVTPADLPLTATVCETNPATAQCVAPPVPRINTNAFAGGSASFSIFVSATAPVALDPENNRITVQFTQGGLVRGATSIAVATE